MICIVPNYLKLVHISRNQLTKWEVEMSWFTGLWLALLGVLAAPNLIISKKTEAKEIIAKLAPYQGWIGAVSAVWGLIKLIGTFKYFDWFSVIPIGIITMLLSALLTLALGLLLGIKGLQTFVQFDHNISCSLSPIDIGTPVNPITESGVTAFNL